MEANIALKNCTNCDGLGTWQYDGYVCFCNCSDGISKANAFQPSVGMPATYMIGTDCYPCTVMSISKNGRKITLSKDKARKQLFVPNAANVMTVYRNTDGTFRGKGGVGSIAFGKRTFSLDPHF